MPKTPGKMHMYDMVKIDTIVFEIVGGGGAFKAPPPGSDRVKTDQIAFILQVHCNKIGRKLFYKISTHSGSIQPSDRQMEKHKANKTDNQ